jgi:undecaprenyl-diphosphatase
LFVRLSEETDEGKYGWFWRGTTAKTSSWGFTGNWRLATAFWNRDLMEIFFAAILGIIQGITEFLPISSSAHLILMPWFFGWDPNGLNFDVSVHLGTTVAVLAFFWKDWIQLARETWAGLKERKPFGNHYRRLAWLLFIGTLPAAVVGILFEDIIEARLRSPVITVFTLVGFGALLLIAERRSRRHREISGYTWADSLWIGFSQAIALIPGVSRSGITITAAMFRNSTRTSAARFSFLLLTPITIGATVLRAWELLSSLGQPLDSSMSVQWAVLCTGVVSASVTGFFCIRFFLRYLQTKSFVPFVIYRFLLAAIVLIYYLKHY